MVTTGRYDFREQLLDGAKQLVTQERNAEYGEPPQDFARIAEMLNALGYRGPGPGGRMLMPRDVAVIQICLKLSRLVWTPSKMDSVMDIAGYSACYWDCIAHEEDEDA